MHIVELSTSSYYAAMLPWQWRSSFARPARSAMAVKSAGSRLNSSR